MPKYKYYSEIYQMNPGVWFIMSDNAFTRKSTNFCVPVFAKAVNYFSI